MHLIDRIIIACCIKGIRTATIAVAVAVVDATAVAVFVVVVVFAVAAVVRTQDHLAESN